MTAVTSLVPIVALVVVVGGLLAWLDEMSRGGGHQRPR